MNLNVRKGDNVIVLTGKDKGKTGKVIATSPKTGKVLVEGVNIATHHKKPRSATEQGGIKKAEAGIDVSNVQIVCPSCNKNARVRHSEVNGKTVRVCAKCGASLDDKKVDKKKSAKKADKKAKAAKSDDVETETKETKKPAKKSAKAETANNVPVEAQSDGKTDKE